MNLIWSKHALNDYSECITYLEQNFSEQTVFKFVKDIEKCRQLLVNNPETFPLSTYKNTRYLVVIPHVTIFYTIKNNYEIQLVRIWNNRKNKSRKKIR